MIDILWYGLLISIGCIVLIAGVSASLDRLAHQRHKRNQREHIEAVAAELNKANGPALVITDRDHPLYCRAGARRGPDLPPGHSLQGRFR